MGILQEAINIVNGDRRKDYGDMADSFKRIAGMWSAYLGKHIDSLDVCKLMILLKVSRAKDNNHRDSYVDIVGYVECADHLMTQEERDTLNRYAKVPHDLFQTEEN